MIDARIQADRHGAILFDAGALPQAGPEWFSPEYWEEQGSLSHRGGGRASACFIDTPVGECVLRHYHRGGAVGPILGDRYLWTGRDNTRAFAEFRLTAALKGQGLPVPQPLAARYVRGGLYYRADLLTRRIPGALTLAQRLGDGALDTDLAVQVGLLLARFHRLGVWHADLNAHNVMVAPEQLYLIDFDRGRIRAPARSWQDENLQRLQRSLIKLGAQKDGREAFEDRIWTPLNEAYLKALTA
ncbi:3-deoxy-D-manno-octulosonic acid kinase [Oleiagrimonas sp. C23AA]|uniref:3-deoxy-D-manno-octulosonic acid kinase n=1 Tax=Oleiagrimonas sp. C23AA TaxID=2719047 RepID=UPI001420FCF5|nr:3-deoxy-D-manno-octulosonic acid kinase [Oleiagrimonas sp. C23AA]NII10300.1 3-deoxy-D-manno-octulosonic acid kinase [Oleiagrimonas sp. C23AA]